MFLSCLYDKLGKDRVGGRHVIHLNAPPKRLIQRHISIGQPRKRKIFHLGDYRGGDEISGAKDGNQLLVSLEQLDDSISIKKIAVTIHP